VELLNQIFKMQQCKSRFSPKFYRARNWLRLSAFLLLFTSIIFLGPNGLSIDPGRVAKPIQAELSVPYRIHFQIRDLVLPGDAGIDIMSPLFAKQNDLTSRLALFIRRAIPDLKMIAIGGPLLLLYIVLAAVFAGWLRVGKKIRVPFTRKVFHFLIFTFAGILQFKYGLSSVVLFGSLVSLAVLYAVYRGDGFAFYEAMARPTDNPHRTLFILIPLLTTALGGVAANLFFAKYAYIGYLVAGWGDAIAEPVGARWGKHKYRVPSLGGVSAVRSLEGSAAVLLVGFAVALAGLLAGRIPFTPAWYVALLCATAGAAVEAVSNHGLDNLTIQVAAAGVIYWLIP